MKSDNANRLPRSHIAKPRARFMFLTRIDKRYYVYAHYAEDSEFPFYIGKGSGQRAWASGKRSQAWYDRARNGFYVKIIKFGLPEQCAYILEKIMIQIARGAYPEGSLVNISDGGNGNPGLDHSFYSREARRIAMSGPNNRLYGKKMPEHIVEAARQKNLGRIHSDERKARQAWLQGGKNHAQLDTRIHNFYHPDGRIFDGLQFDFVEFSGLKRPNICLLIKGKIRTSGGWRYGGLTEN